jgi:hypothetical protein
VSVQSPTPRLRRALALGTAAAFGLGGFFATPAFAETTSADAPISGETFESNAFELLETEGVEAVGHDAEGNIVIRTSETSDAVAEFDATYDNVVVQTIVGGYSSMATTDVVGGAGYLVEAGELLGACSTGFSGWTPEGEPAVITAGHCAVGATSPAALSTPSGDPAGGGPSDSAGAPYAVIGDFGFSQYGGPGNTPGDTNDTSVDIAVIDVDNVALDLLPAVTDWTTTGDLSQSTTAITSVGTVDLTQPVSKSGRTTGKSTSTGTLTAGWANVEGDDGDDHIVKGFGGPMAVLGGDSGGAVYQGEKAVGLVSGGNQPGTEIWVADLVSGLAQTDGYTVMLEIDAPVLVTPANGSEVERGAQISGTGVIGSTVTVTPTGGESFSIPTNAEGNWSFPAPTALGNYGFSVQSVSGFNTSEVNTYALEVVPAPLVAPVIETPADGTTVETELTSVSGTALPGATVTLDGDVTGTALVGSDGTWSVATSLSYGAYTVTATQASEGETSPVASSGFAVVPVAPSISTPGEGDSFPASDAPETTSGVGIEGATVTVSVNGEVVGTADIEGELPVDEVPLANAAGDFNAAALPGDNWEVALADSVVTGANVISVTQEINGVSSAAATATFEVRAAAVEPPTEGDDDGDNGDGLAVTGGPDMMPIGIAAWLLIAGGIATTVIVRKRRLSAEV